MAGVPIADIGTNLRGANKDSMGQARIFLVTKTRCHAYLGVALIRAYDGTYLVDCRMWFEGNGCDGIWR